jgi:hypothetical protein
MTFVLVDRPLRESYRDLVFLREEVARAGSSHPAPCVKSPQTLRLVYCAGGLLMLPLRKHPGRSPR